MSLNYNNVVDELGSIFPHLKKKIDEVIDWSGGSLKHIIFGQVFNPYIKSIFVNNIEGSFENDRLKVVAFLELMANSNDDDVRAVLTDTVLEELLDCPKEFSMIEPYLLAETSSFLPFIKQAMGYK